jgi:tetratricopeptide (TPR) repeat protein
MAAPTPKHKSSELIDRLNAVTLNPDEFTLKSIERDANKLIHSDPRSGYMILGMIDSMNGELEKTKKHFFNALRFSNDDVVRHNYAFALFRLFAFEEAYEVNVSLVDDYPGVSEHLFYSIEMGLYAGRQERLDELLDSLEKLNIELEPEHQRFADMAVNLRELMGDSLHSVASTFSKFMLGRGLSWNYRAVQSTPDSPYVLYFSVPLTPIEIADLNFEVGQELAMADPYLGEHLIFMCRPAE